MTGWKIFGRYGSKTAAERRVELEQRGGTAARGYEFDIRRKFVGRSVDPAYSDKNGYAWIIMYRRK